MSVKGRGCPAVNGTEVVPSHRYHVRAKEPWDMAFPIAKPPGTLSVLVVATAAMLCYANSLDGHFVFDDSEAIVNNDDLRPDRPVWNLLYNDFWGTRLTHNASHKSYRPLTVLSFRWNYWLSGGLRPWSFHLTNVVLHAIVSALLLPVYNVLFGDHCPRAAFLAALLFAVHPVHSEAVAGVVGRADLLCTSFYLLSFLVFCSSLAYEGRAAGTAMLFLSLFLCALAMFSKEQGLTVIGLCSAYDIIVHSKVHPSSVVSSLWRVLSQRARRLRSSSSDEEANPVCGLREVMPGPAAALSRRLLLRQFTLAATGIALLFVRWRVMDSSTPIFQRVDNPASFADSVVTRVLTYNYIYALNAWLLVCPEWLCFDWSMGCLPLLSATTFDPRILAAAAFWATFLLLAWRCFTTTTGRSRRSLTMAVALTVVPFLPATNIFFRVGFVVAERVLYLPSAGFCMLIALGSRPLARRASWRRAWRPCYLLLVLVFGLRAGLRSAEWRSELLLFRSGLRVCPLNAKVHYNVAKNAADAGDRALALTEYREALRLNEDYDQAMNNLANILKDEGKLHEAEAYLRRAVEIRPDFAAAWMNLGIVLAGLKRHEQAEASYFTALMHRKRYPDCYYNLGNLYLEQQRYEDAYKAWRNATALKVTHTVAWSNMIIMLDTIGESAKAEAVAHEALSALPSEPSIHFNLANILGKAGRFAEAEKHFTAAITLDRHNAVYYTNLGLSRGHILRSAISCDGAGVLYHRWHKYEQARSLYQRALEMNPGLQSAQDNLALLHRAVARAQPPPTDSE